MKHDTTVKWKYGRKVIPAPAGLKVWYVWGDEADAPEGPFDVLAIGFRDHSIQATAQPKTLSTSKRGYVEWSVNHVDYAEEAATPWEYDTAWFYVLQDWETPWIQHGDEAFLSEDAAREHLSEIKAIKARREAREQEGKY